MRKLALILSVALILLSLFSCGKQNETIELVYQEEYTIENEKLANTDGLKWRSSDNKIASVDNGVITANDVGNAIIVAMSGDKTVASFNVRVFSVPISEIVLSAQKYEMKDGDTYKLSYTLFPENASDYGLTWKSSDESVATVSPDGTVTATAVGKTIISVSNDEGFKATCDITVNQKSAYERLSKDEKAFVDCALKNLNDFKNPDSVKIKDVQKNGSSQWIVRLSAQNGFGGNNSEVYYLSSSLGFWNWDSLDIDQTISITPDKSFDISLINEAIDDMR